MNTKTIRHFFAFQTSHGGAFWMNNDGSTNECGALHRFATSDQRDAWLGEDWKAARDIDSDNERRAVTTRNLPHGWTVYGNQAEYLDHDEAGECEWMLPGWMTA